MTLKKSIKILLNKLKLKFSYRKSPKYLSSINKNPNILNGMIAYNKYGGYFNPISSQQRPAVQQILNGKVYEPDTIAFIRDNCYKGDIIHAGTFFGDFLPGISSALNQKAKVWAFEPNNENFKCAQITCMINQLQNVNLYNAGLGDIATNLKMLVKSDEGESLGGGSYISNENHKGKSIEIELVKIDDIIPVDRDISILQLDVEGYEKQALIGAMDTIKRNKPIIILEDNNKIIESAWFRENILALGYDKFCKLHENTVFKTVK